MDVGVRNNQVRDSVRKGVAYHREFAVDEYRRRCHGLGRISEAWMPTLHSADVQMRLHRVPRVADLAEKLTGNDAVPECHGNGTGIHVSKMYAVPFAEENHMIAARSIGAIGVQRRAIGHAIFSSDHLAGTGRDDFGAEYRVLAELLGEKARRAEPQRIDLDNIQRVLDRGIHRVLVDHEVGSTAANAVGAIAQRWRQRQRFARINAALEYRRDRHCPIGGQERVCSNEKKALCSTSWVAKQRATPASGDGIGSQQGR